MNTLFNNLFIKAHKFNFFPNLSVQWLNIECTANNVPFNGALIYFSPNESTKSLIIEPKYTR